MLGFNKFNHNNPVLGKVGDVYDDSSFVNRYTKNTRYPIYAVIFSNQLKVPYQDYESISFDEIASGVKKEIHPLIGEFVEINKNIPFLEISYPFFEYLLLNSKIWVSYESEKLNTFSLYIKTVPEKEDDYHYYNIITKKQVTLTSNTLVIKAEWDGSDNDVFLLWFDYMAKFLSMTKVFEMACMMWGKVGKHINREARTQEEMDQALAKLITLSPIISFDAQTINDHVEKIVLVEAEELNKYLISMYIWKDRSLAELARVANINDKEERKTTGENFKDIYSIKCRQMLVQDRLNYFSAKTLEYWGVSLEFKSIAEINAESSVEDGVETDDSQNEVL